MKKESKILKELYSVALELYDEAPWQWMYESEVFGVHPPERKEPYFASIMGSSGAFPAVSFYDGTRALDQFMQIQELQEVARPEDVLLIPHFMVLFEEHDMLQQEEREQIRNLGYSLSERDRWPVLQQNIPGHPPVFPGPAELQNLVPVLEQTLHVIGRSRKETVPIPTRNKEGIRIFVRVCDNSKETWRDEIRIIRLKSIPFTISYPREQIEQLKRLPLQKRVLEVDLVLMPTPVRDRDPEYFPFLLLLVEEQSGYVVHFELITPHPGIDEMIASCASLLVSILLQQEMCPREIRIRSRLLHPVFKAVLDKTPVRLVLQPYLHSIDEALEGLMGFLG